MICTRASGLLVVVGLQLLVILALRATSGTGGKHDLETALGAREEELRAARAEIADLRRALHGAGIGKPVPPALSSGSPTASASSDFYNSRHSRIPPSKPGTTAPSRTASTPPPALAAKCAAALQAADPSPTGSRPIPGGDLESPGVLEASFAARSVGGELIFLSVGDTRDHRRAAKDPALKSIRWELLNGTVSTHSGIPSGLGIHP